MRVASLPYKLFNCNDKNKIRQWFKFLNTHSEIEGVELYPMDADTPWWTVKYLKNLLEELGRPVSMLNTAQCIWDHNTELTSSHIEQQAELILRDLDLANFFGTKIIKYGGVPGWDPSMFWTSLETLVDISAQIMSKVLHKFKINRTKLIIENHPSDVSGNKRYFDLLFKEVPDTTLGINFDFLNCFTYPGQSPEEWLSDKIITKRIYYSHVGQGQKSKAGIEKGALKDGILDMRRLLGLLKKAGYDGWLSFEYSESDIQEVSRSTLYLKSMWREI